MTASSRLRIGVLGAANIARMFCTSVAPSSAVVVSAVASRTKDKAETFARELRIPRALGSYEEMLKDPDLDAIYIPLPNSMHAEWAIRAAEAGKHVLCEKPMAMTAAETKSMFEAARRNKVILREGYPYMAQPQTATLRRWLKEGAIGKVRLIRSSFGVYFDDPTNIRLSPTLGGGALFDAGSYAVSLVRLVANERPTRVHAAAERAANGVDMTTVATLAFQSGLLAQVSCTFATGYHRHALIAGDNGVIETNYLNHPPMAGPAVLQIKRGRANLAPFEPEKVPDGNGFLLEVDSFARLLREGEQHWTGATEQESIDIMLILDAISKSSSSGRWEEVGS